MNISTWTIIVSILFLGSCQKEDTEVTPDKRFLFLDRTEIHFASRETAKALLGTSDDYTRSLSLFDIKAKTKNKKASREKDYLDFAADQALEWTVAEIEAFKKTIRSAERRIKNLKITLDLPAKISIVKSTEGEEGDNNYTRLTFIVMDEPDEETFLHELFHVYSRANPLKKDLIYQTINFKKCNRIEFPKELHDLKMTNPDAPFLENYLTVKIDGIDRDVVFITHSETDYDQGGFFDYFNQSLLLLQDDGDNKIPLIEEGMPVMREFSEASNLSDLIGKNTEYNIHPEEICAEHFRMLIMEELVSEPQYLNKMKSLLTD